ncbi:MAG: bifunctional folylpolyglutamate synthase/dihydrofolate synthase [Acholeplasmataceae bacterium]
MRFKNLETALGWIERQVKFKPKKDLARMKKALDETGLSFDGVTKVHVAGTNGKGSVCQMITAIADRAGLSVGTFTSPYLVRFNERIRVNREEIADDRLLALIDYMYDFNDRFYRKHGETLAFFELVTLMALIYFKERKVDLIVMEVGLGGLLDATNVLNYDLSLITNIGFDHMKQLGSTRPEIARNKLGILKPGNHLITTIDDELRPLFIEHAERIGASITCLDRSSVTVLSERPHVFVYEGETYRLNLLGSYQVDNALLALSAAKTLFKKIDPKTLRYGLEHAVSPGRLERFAEGVYLDGAHNVDAISALIVSVSRLFPDQRITYLASFLASKDIAGMLDRLKEAAHAVLLTSFPDERYEDLEEYARGKVRFVADPAKAYRFACELGRAGIVVITGSIHFIGYVKRTFKK